MANTINLETVTKPAAMKINVNEILHKMKPTSLTSATQTSTLKNGRLHYIQLRISVLRFL